MTLQLAERINLADLTLSFDGEVVNATHPVHGEVGIMVLCAPSAYSPGRVIMELEVLPEFQRQGIATALWHWAVRQGLNPAHSSARSADGDAWAASVSPPSDIPPNSWLEDDSDDD